MYDLFNQPIEVHSREGNRESENHLNDNRRHFEGKCLELLKRLLNGERLQFANEVRSIGDLRRRSLDLIESGINVQRTFIEGTRIKEYWLTENEIKRIKQMSLPL